MLLPRNQRLNPANRSDGTLKRDSNNVRLFLLVLRNPFSVAKISLESPTDTVNYRSKLNPKINRNFEIFDPVDFLATLSQHIPDKGVQMVRYYGLYSNWQRGCARKGTGRSKAGAKLPHPGPNPDRRRRPSYRLGSPGSDPASLAHGSVRMSEVRKRDASDCGH